MTSDEALLSLLKSGMGHASLPLPSDLDWQEVHDHAKYHGVTAIVMDGIEASGLVLPREIMRLWMADMVKVESAYAKGTRAIAGLAEVYRQAGIPLMVIKGYGLSLDYPVPDHRPTGDIDIWNFGRQKEADGFLSELSGMVVDNSVHNHSVFHYMGMLVENHFDFLNIHAHRSNSKMEMILKEMVASPEQCVSSDKIENLYFPKADFNALYLLRHMASHFAAESVNLRQLLDWATFMTAHSSEIDIPSFMTAVKEYNMDSFLACINAICIDELGFGRDSFPEMSVDPELKQRVLNDILDIGSTVPQPGLLHVGQRVRRWLGNSWKHRIVFSESLAGTFLSQAVAHLMKPASFNH